MVASYSGVPSVEPTLNPPSDFEQITPSPGAFGAQVSRGLEEAGAGALKTGEFFGQVAADDQSNKWQREADNLLNGTGQVGPDGKIDQGYLGLTGEDALRARPQLEQQLDALRQQYRGGLPSARAELQFDDFTRRYQSLLLSKAGSHAEQQSKVYGVSVNDAGLANTERTIANYYNDDEHFKHSMEDARKFAVQKAQLMGQSPAGAIAEADSRAVAARLNGALAQNDYGSAKQIFQQYGNLLDDKLRPTYENHMRAEGYRIDGDALYNRARGAGPSPSGPAGPIPALPAAPDQYAPLIKQSAAQYNVPEELLTRVLSAENGFKPTGVSSAGARGIAQFMPETAARYGIDPDNPQQAIPAAAHYLADLKADKGTWNDAVRGYLGGDPHKDASYTRAGVPQLIDSLDGGGGAPAASAASPSGRVMAAGDSIAYGAQKFGGAGGVGVDDVTKPEAALADAAGSRNPQQALDFVKTHPERFQGNKVIWSSGLMNAGLANVPASDPKAQAVLQTVGEQLDALKAAGATPVLAGVDQGKFAPYNAELKKVADAHGVPFAGALPTNDVHPGAQGYKDYTANASKLFPAATAGAPAAPDQVQGQPGSPATGARLVGNGPVMPPGNPAPGVAEIARQQAQEIQDYARTLDNIDRMAGSASPEAVAHASQRAEREHNRHEAVLNGQMKAVTEARNAQATAYWRELRPDVPVPDDFFDRVHSDPLLDGATIHALDTAAQTHMKKTVAGDLISYGPKFYEAYHRLSLDDTDPEKLRDPTQLFPMAEPKKDGTQDLTQAGVSALLQRMDELKKRDPILAEKKKDLMNLLMPLDRANEEYSPDVRMQRYKLDWDIDQQIHQAQQDKKNPYNLFNPSSPEWIGQHYQDQINANLLKAKIEGNPDLRTEAGIVAAVKAGKLTREQAAERLRAIGVPIADPTTPPAPTAPLR